MNNGINKIYVEIFPNHVHKKRVENFQAIQKNNVWRWRSVGFRIPSADSLFK